MNVNELCDCSSSIRSWVTRVVDMYFSSRLNCLSYRSPFHRLIHAYAYCIHQYQITKKFNISITHIHALCSDIKRKTLSCIRMMWRRGETWRWRRLCTKAIEISWSGQSSFERTMDFSTLFHLNTMFKWNKNPIAISYQLHF